MGPLHTVMCNMCQTRLVPLEKAVLDIKSFRDLAKHSSEALSGPFKRTKVTNSDIGVSPDTARECPSSKRARSYCSTCHERSTRMYK